MLKVQASIQRSALNTGRILSAGGHFEGPLSLHFVLYMLKVQASIQRSALSQCHTKLNSCSRHNHANTPFSLERDEKREKGRRRRTGVVLPIEVGVIGANQFPIGSSSSLPLPMAATMMGLGSMPV